MILGLNPGPHMCQASSLMLSTVLTPLLSHMFSLSCPCWPCTYNPVPQPPEYLRSQAYVIQHPTVLLAQKLTAVKLALFYLEYRWVLGRKFIISH